MPMPQLIPILFDGGDGPAAVELTAEPDRTLDLTLIPSSEGDSGEDDPQPLFGEAGGAWDRLSGKEQVELYLDAFALCFNHGRRWLDP